jgi:hypothetical protein
VSMQIPNVKIKVNLFSPFESGLPYVSMQIPTVKIKVNLFPGLEVELTRQQ